MICDTVRALKAFGNIINVNYYQELFNLLWSTGYDTVTWYWICLEQWTWNWNQSVGAMHKHSIYIANRTEHLQSI